MNKQFDKIQSKKPSMNIQDSSLSTVEISGEESNYGVPAVLSPIAAESTGLVNDISTLVAKTDKEWVDNIERLYKDKELLEQMSKSSSTLVSEQYSFDSGLVSKRKMMSFLELDPALEPRQFFKRR